MTMSAPQLSLDDIRVRLHARGERMTRPRQAVLLALAEQPGHPTAEQLVSAVAERDSTVHRASVYRTLDALAQLGIVQHVHLGHGPTVYHLVSAVTITCTSTVWGADRSPTRPSACSSRPPPAST